jgi:hypothetical protein
LCGRAHDDDLRAQSLKLCLAEAGMIEAMAVNVASGSMDAVGEKSGMDESE